jgi:hypothetical protein
MAIAVLTGEQRATIKQRASDTSAWQDEADLERRRRVGAELQKVVAESGILDGAILDSKTFCELIGLQWQIQNLNPLPMPKLLGLYASRVYFGGFEGTPEDLLAIRKEETGEEGMYEGADLKVVTEAVRNMASQSPGIQYGGATTLLRQQGAGPAIVSAFLHLLHPAEYALINGASQAPFVKNGWLGVTTSQRRQAKAVAMERFASVAEASDPVLSTLFRWQIFLEEVREIGAFADYHQADQFIWAIDAEPCPDIETLLKQIMKQVDQEKENTRVRAEAEARARQLIEAMR